MEKSMPNHITRCNPEKDGLLSSQDFFLMLSMNDSQSTFNYSLQIWAVTINILKHYINKIFKLTIPVHLCDTSRTAESSGGWSGYHGKQLH